MTGDITPEYVLGQLEKGQLFPFYLFYGPSEFRVETVLTRIRKSYIPEQARDFNLHIYYGARKEQGEKANLADILDTAQSHPFLSQRRLVIVRRTENFLDTDLERFISYFDDPLETTCLIFVSSKPDFRKKFYRKIRDSGRAVNFRKLYESQLVPWVKKTAEELGFTIETQACDYLIEIVGNRLIDLYSELEKLYLRHGKTIVGVKEVKEIAVYSRIYTIFELMDQISLRRPVQSLLSLNRYLEEEDRTAPLRFVGMLNRQIGLLSKTKSIMKAGGEKTDLARKLRVQPFIASKLAKQYKKWSTDDLERALKLLYRVDGLLKSDAHQHLILENLVLSLCMPASSQLMNDR
jgi:DNA polymerase-3 subunit delta